MRRAVAGDRFRIAAVAIVRIPAMLFSLLVASSGRSQHRRRANAHSCGVFRRATGKTKTHLGEQLLSRNERAALLTRYDPTVTQGWKTGGRPRVLSMA
jgi:hypothetical protein